MSDVDYRPAKYTLRLVRGMKHVLQALIKDDDPESVSYGDPIDITNDTVELLIQESVGGTQIFKQANGVGNHYDPTNGLTRFTINPSDTTGASAEHATTWYYAIHYKSSSVESAPAAGPCQVTPYATTTIS
jgi:hypothetical protein